MSEKKDFVLKLFFVIFLAILITLILYIAEKKTSNDFLSIYFEDATKLPSYANMGDTINFNFIVENNLSRVVNLNFYIYFENDENISLIEQFNHLAKPGKETIYDSYRINKDFQRARIRIVEVNTNKEIFFYLEKAEKIQYYGGYGQGNLDCVPYAGKVDADNLEIEASGNYVEGYPQFQVWINGFLVAEFNVTERVFKYEIENKFVLGENYVDIVYTNDYEKNGLDRNLNIYRILIGTDTINNTIIDNGKYKLAFDCKETKNGNILFSEGALRFFVKK